MAFLVLWLLHSPALEYTHALRKKKIHGSSNLGGGGGAWSCCSFICHGWLISMGRSPVSEEKQRRRRGCGEDWEEGKERKLWQQCKNTQINLKEKEKHPSSGLKTSAFVLFCFVLALECSAWRWVWGKPATQHPYFFLQSRLVTFPDSLLKAIHSCAK